MLEFLKNNIFTTAGRLNRLRYFKYTFCLGVFFGIVEVICKLIVSADENSAAVDVIETLISFPLAVGSIMLQIRRLHDLDKSAWFVLLSAIPGVNLLFGLYLLFFKGTDGTNQYGYDPLLFEN